MYFQSVHDIINSIESKGDREQVQQYFSSQQREIEMLMDERNYLRSQVSLALRSVKFDLDSEIR